MANMSYCRFENTVRDLRDCHNALLNDDLSELSETEKSSALLLIKMCSEISDDSEDFRERINEEEEECK